MSDIKYSIHFYSPWHCGSGLSAGADLDALVITDKSGMPYIPGKTLKGLIREAVEDYSALSNALPYESINKAFGIPADPDHTDTEISGTAFFTNATISADETEAIISNNAQAYLFNKISSTAISPQGIAEDNSLRTIQTVVPCTLHASIYNVPEDVAEVIGHSFGLIHHIGLNRSRGLGRCDFNIEKGGRQ